MLDLHTKKERYDHFQKSEYEYKKHKSVKRLEKELEKGK